MTFKAISQLFVLGCSWSIGFFMVEEVGKTVGSVTAYLFTIINVLQGVLLFVVHCLLNRQVRLTISFLTNLAPRVLELTFLLFLLPFYLYFQAFFYLRGRFRGHLGMLCPLYFIHSAS
jgi:hypothetical protein